VVKFQSTHYQKTLFDPPLRAVGALRNICGEFAELCTQRVSGARRLRTDSRQTICPDLHFDDNIWFECKSVGKSGYAIIYQKRYEKERTFISQGNQLVYWIWSHGGAIGKAASVGEIQQQFSENLRCVYVVDCRELWSYLDETPVILNNSYFSNSRAGGFKGSGWRINKAQLKKITGLAGRTAGFYCRGVYVPSVPIYANSLWA
jgi:hypothetical protein